MKKMIFVALAAAILLCLNVTPAKAQTYYCYHLTGFCDQIQVQKDYLKGAYGVWDYTCDGVTLTQIAGKGVNLVSRPVSGGGVPDNETFRFRFWNSYGTFDLVSWNGVSITTFQLGASFTKSKSPCTFLTGKKPDKPSLLSTLGFQAPLAK